MACGSMMIMKFAGSEYRLDVTSVEKHEKLAKNAREKVYQQEQTKTIKTTIQL